jgi:CheY-like chemotaxis protein
MSEPSLPVALVVDDASTSRIFLRALLKRAGYAVETAASGEEALARFVPGKFEIVFMDIVMPGIDGIQTARTLKGRCGDIFTPVIFVTGEGDEGSLVRAIEAGGDDFLTKPVTPAVLLAKLQAMARIRAVHERTRLLYARVIEDQEIAKEVFDRAVGRRAVVSPDLRFRLIPAEVFSGDILLSALSPTGRLFVLVGDFTGHGLTAALGAMPVSDAFRAMVALDMPVEAILGELNRKVADALPRGHFLAASLMSVGPDLNTISVANCGMPDLLLCGPQGVRAHIRADSLALGILEDASFGAAVRSLPIERGERLVFASDGVTEAANADGAAFGEARLEALLAEPDEKNAGAAALVSAALDRFRGATPFADDASVVEIRFTDGLFADGAFPALNAMAVDSRQASGQSPLRQVCH